MRIDVVLNPAEIALLPKRDLTRTTCVVFDVLRATSSMITALGNGAREIYPVRTIEEARELKSDMPGVVLGGERHGEMIDGFDVGNSPFEYRGFAGRTIVTTTTNGTLALRACEGAETVLVGALLNLAELADEVSWREPEELLLVCAGTFEEFALEDAYAAGMLIAALPAAQLSDSAHAALALTKQFSTPVAALRAARNGRTLEANGRRKEVDWCAQLSVFTVVGIMEQAVIRPIED